MVLSKQEILDRMSKFDVKHPQNLVITPLLYTNNSEVFDADSVDLRLGCYFLLPRTLDQPFFSPDKRTATSLHVRAHIPLGQFLVVPAHQTILGATLEFIKLPDDVSGQVLTKSSVARTFVVVETAPWIHPQYRGCLTLEIANVSNTPVLLYPGRKICQLVLMHVGSDKTKRESSKTKRAVPEEGKIDTGYFGPVYPEAPKFKDPQCDLLEIGVTCVSRLRRTRLSMVDGEWEEKLEEGEGEEKRKSKSA
jgi:dCTP deaminase